MKKEVKKLLAYLLALVIAITSVFTGQIVTKTTAKAAMFEDVTEITEIIGITEITGITAESGAPVSTTTNEKGQTVYTLTGDVTNGLKITLTAGETVILDGKGYSIHGRDEIEDERDSATPALEIAGSGTLILKNTNLTGGNGNDDLGYEGQGAVALRVTSPKVSLILQQTVTITGGTAAVGRTTGSPSGNGSSGIEFSGATLKVDSGSQVTIKGSDGYQGINYWDEYDHFRLEGTPGGCALNFTGGSLLVCDDAWLTLTGGNGGQGASGLEGVGGWYQSYYGVANGTNGGNGGDALSFTGSVYTVSSSAKVTYTPGTGGSGGVAGTYKNSDGTTLLAGDAGQTGNDGSRFAYERGLVPDKTLLQSALSEGDEVITVTLHYSDYTQTYYAKKDSTINPAYLPDTDYYTVSRWYTDESLETPVDTGEMLTLAQNTDFYMKYTFKVSFSTGNDTIPVADQTVTYPAAVTKPEDPTKTGYTFGGWYTDEACTNAYDFSQPVTIDMTLYAKWTIITYTVSFDSLGGSPVDVEIADYGTLVTKPEDPTKTGYTFGGWYTDEACTKAYIFDQPVTKDMTLHAKWTINTHTVTFDSLGGSSVDVETADYETAVTKPEDPTKTGYTFGGWYTDEACTKAYDFATPVTGDMILYAKWNEIPRPTGTPQPTMTPKPTGAPQPTVIPTSEPTGTPEPTKAPEPTVTPTSEPTGTPQPTKAPKPTVIPTLEPTAGPQPAATVTLNVSAIVLQKGKSTTAVKATLGKGDSIEKWESSDTKVATVTKKGKIKAKKAGTAVITVTTKRGASASVEVKVQKKKVKTQKLTVINVKKQKLTLKKGKTFKIKTELTPLTSQEKITFKSSDKKVAKVSKSGKIKALKAGKAVITVKSGTEVVKVKVKVRKR